MKNSKNSGYTKENLKDEVTTKPSTENEVTVIDVSEGKIDIFGYGETIYYLDLRTPGEYYITDIHNKGHVTLYFGYTPDGKYPKYVLYSANFEGASSRVDTENDIYGQYVDIKPSPYYGKPTYVKVFDRYAIVYQLFEI